jgi:hypothetical protein
MNNLELERRLRDFSVKVTCADVNTDPYSLPGSHWTVFHFPRLGPSEFFDSMSERAKTYNSRFEYVLANNGRGIFTRRTKFNRKTAIPAEPTAFISFESDINTALSATSWKTSAEKSCRKTIEKY